MPAVTLLCLPYAGGNAAVYRAWPERLPRWAKAVPLHMPARGVRLRMAPVHRWQDLIGLLENDAVDAVGDAPYAIFGHSLGALVALELGHALWRRLGRAPVWLGVSACTAPGGREREDHWLDCPQAELLAEMRSLSGTSDEVLANEELMALVMPMVRADFHLSGTYERRVRTPLPSAMLALAGTRDEEVAGQPANVAAWADEVSGPFETAWLDAGHFFIDTHRDDVIDRVVVSLDRHLHRAAGSRDVAAGRSTTVTVLPGDLP